MIDQHAGEHANHERHNLIGTPQQNVDRIVDGFRDDQYFGGSKRLLAAINSDIANLLLLTGLFIVVGNQINHICYSQ